jgi:hypothetical protein
MNAPNILTRRTRVLYHFTAGRFVAPIKAEGLTKGVLPWHRCRRTGEPIVIRAWPEQRMTAAGVRRMRSHEAELERMAKGGNVFAAKELARLFPGFQWLTSSPNWDQPFALLGELPFAKNANRITLCVPEAESLGLFHWRTLCERTRPPAAEELNTSAVDWENWHVYHGRIPTSWFMEIARNPGVTVGAAFLTEGAG